MPVNVSNATLLYPLNTLANVVENSKVIATCDAGFEHHFNETRQKFNCTNQGWNVTELEHCTAGMCQIPGIM